MRILLLWDGYGIVWKPTLLLQKNFVTLRRRFKTLAESFSHQSNVSLVYEIYEKIFHSFENRTNQSTGKEWLLIF